VRGDGEGGMRGDDFLSWRGEEDGGGEVRRVEVEVVVGVA
jgi:hypothetical protein